MKSEIEIKKQLEKFEEWFYSEDDIEKNKKHISAIKALRWVLQ